MNISEIRLSILVFSSSTLWHFLLHLYCLLCLLPSNSPLMGFPQLILNWNAASCFISLYKLWNNKSIYGCPSSCFLCSFWNVFNNHSNQVMVLFWHSLHSMWPVLFGDMLITFFLLLSDKVHTDVSSGSVHDYLAVWLPNVSVWLSSIFFKRESTPWGLNCKCYLRFSLSLPSFPPSPQAITSVNSRST